MIEFANLLLGRIVDGRHEYAQIPKGVSVPELPNVDKPTLVAPENGISEVQVSVEGSSSLFTLVE